MRYSVLLLLVLTSCGRLDLGDFASYVHDFEADARANGADIEITHLEVRRSDTGLPGVEVGLCRHGVTPLVEVDGAFWAGATEEQRHILIYHELGHCILGRKHTKESDLADRPSSVMAPNLLPTWAWEKYRAQYLTELFSGGN